MASINPTNPISTILIYAGHGIENPDLKQSLFDLVCSTSLEEPAIEHVGKGPYNESVDKHLSIFWNVNKIYDKKWQIKIVYGEQIIEELGKSPLDKIVLVIPAGKSSNLDHVFTNEQLKCIKKAIAVGGMRYFATCGSAYWSCTSRKYKSLAQTLVKPGNLNILHRTAKGPLSPDSEKHGADFFHEAVEVTAGNLKAKILLSGGGTFKEDPEEPTDPLLVDQKTVTLAEYSTEFLKLRGKDVSWKPCAISSYYGKGKLILEMANPGYEKVDAERYKKIFADRTEDWDEINRTISSLAERMAFAYQLIKTFEDPYTTL